MAALFMLAAWPLCRATWNIHPKVIIIYYPFYLITLVKILKDLGIEGSEETSKIFIYIYFSAGHVLYRTTRMKQPPLVLAARQLLHQIYILPFKDL